MLWLANILTTQNVLGGSSSLEVISGMSVVRNDLLTPEELSRVVTSQVEIVLRSWNPVVGFNEFFEFGFKTVEEVVMFVHKVIVRVSEIFEFKKEHSVISVVVSPDSTVVDKIAGNIFKILGRSSSDGVTDSFNVVLFTGKRLEVGLDLIDEAFGLNNVLPLVPIDGGDSIDVGSVEVADKGAELDDVAFTFCGSGLRRDGCHPFFNFFLTGSRVVFNLISAGNSSANS